MKILVAVDGSKFALHAVKYAAKLVASLQSGRHSITLICVHDDTGLNHAKSFVGKKTVADYLHEVREKELKPARKVLDTAGIRHDMVERTGHVTKEILDCAKKGKFDLVVLGSKGRGAIADLLIGSVAQRVLAAAQQPVLLVK
ncbi:universal stress protein UspA [Achromobacter piechaudii]|uniref:universal stress protein n=1 Tax=Achromobacter piechaudii TaxID=72556 RepID=UPI0006806ACF|nr:universal stress protein [Achromobacter piechaudii]KNY09491.1 universal stress protein UspA [Achromobacter piechaudii]